MRLLHPPLPILTSHRRRRPSTRRHSLRPRLLHTRDRVPPHGAHLVVPRHAAAFQGFAVDGVWHLGRTVWIAGRVCWSLVGDRGGDGDSGVHLIDGARERGNRNVGVRFALGSSATLFLPKIVRKNRDMDINDGGLSVVLAGTLSRTSSTTSIAATRRRTPPAPLCPP